MVAAQPDSSPVPDRFAGRTDEQVLKIAQDAYRRAEALPARTGQRQKEWRIFDSAMSELMARAMSYVLWKIHEREAAGEIGLPDGHIAATILEVARRNGSGTAEQDDEVSP